MDNSVKELLYNNVLDVIEIIKKAYIDTQKYYAEKNEPYDFLYFNMYRTFTKGYCYQFTRFLRDIYKDAKIAVKDIKYAPIIHIYTVIGDSAYDIKGSRKIEDLVYLDEDEIKNIEENHYEVPEEVYNVMKNYLDDYLDKYIKDNMK